MGDLDRLFAHKTFLGLTNFWDLTELAT